MYHLSPRHIFLTENEAMVNCLKNGHESRLPALPSTKRLPAAQGFGGRNLAQAGETLRFGVQARARTRSFQKPLTDRRGWVKVKLKFIFKMRIPYGKQSL